MRLFTALWPPAAVLDELDAALAEVDPGRRWTPRERRHVTLCFHGDADPEVEQSRLRATAGLPAPRLRLAGAGTFPGVVWMGVEADEALAGLVRAAGGDPAAFVAHLTVGRRHERHDRPDGLERFSGSWWTPDHVALVASGQPYRTVARAALDIDPRRAPG